MKKVMFLLMSFILLYSCQESEFTDSDKKASEYLPMSIGNYWIYQQFIINPDGTEEAKQIFDSVYIKRDSIIDGHRYFEIVNSNPLSTSSNFERDSSGCLVELKLGINIGIPNRYVLFSEHNLTDTISRYYFEFEMDTLYSITIRMEKSQQPISVPAGTFEVLNAKQTVIGNPKYTNYPEPRYYNQYYAKKVGNILYTRGYLNWLGIIEYRLIRYSIIDN